MKSYNSVIFLFVLLSLLACCVSAADINNSDVDSHSSCAVACDSSASPVESVNIQEKEISNVKSGYSDYSSTKVESYDSFCSAIKNYSTYRGGRVVELAEGDYVADDSFNATIDVSYDYFTKNPLVIGGNGNTIVTNNHTLRIDLKESCVNVNDCVFVNSTVYFEGLTGIEYTELEERTLDFSCLEFNNCTFVGSNITAHFNLNMSLVNCRFVSTSFNLGASENLTIANCSFSDFSCDSNIYSETLNIMGCSFNASSDSSEDSSNQLIYLGSQGNVTICDCIFKSIDNYNAIIYSIHNYGLFDISDNVFEGNDVDEIIFIGCRMSGYSNIVNNTFVFNNVSHVISITNYTNYYGSNSNLNITGNVFINNNGDSGCVLYAKYDVNLTGNVFVNNTSDGLGIILNNARINSYNNSYCYNTAAKGAVVYNCKVFKSTKDYYNHNVALKLAGCIYNCGYLELKSSTMKFNTAVYASVIFNRVNATAVIYKGNIYKNKATRNATLYNSGNLTMNYTTVNLNKATVGVVYNTALLDIYNCAFKNNTCHVASVLYNTGEGNVTIVNSVFTLNKAKLNATVYNNATLNIINTTIRNMGFNNYLIINYGFMHIDDNSTIVNINHPDEEVIIDYSK